MEARQAQPVVRVAVADAHVVVLVDVDRPEQCLVAQSAVRVVGVLVEVGCVGQQFQRVVEVRTRISVVAVVSVDPVLDGSSDAVIRSCSFLSMSSGMAPA